MKKGFTTGSCAAAAAKAAAFMLLSGRKISEIEIDTPGGYKYCPHLEKTDAGSSFVRCGVRKQSGDDPDITNGILVFAKVSRIETLELAGQAEAPRPAGRAEDPRHVGRVEIVGGEGIGRVTRPGLDQPVGSAAINSVPRQMIKKEVREVMDFFDYGGSLQVEISVPGGRELAAKTFNPRLGIEGGISIIGTTGIVDPMSTRALLDTIQVELRQQKAMGAPVAVVSPGNYGLDFMRERYGYDLDRAVKCSNYIGETIDMAARLGFTKMLLCGHVGKLIKVSGGIMNTHSREADCRMELMAIAGLKSGAACEAVLEILDCVSTEEAIGVYLKEGIQRQCFDYIMNRAGYYLNNRGAGRIQVECIMYSNQYGLLGLTEKAEAFLDEAKG